MSRHALIDATPECNPFVDRGSAAKQERNCKEGVWSSDPLLGVLWVEVIQNVAGAADISYTVFRIRD